MPSVDFGACLSNYWFVWTVNGLGSIFGLAINMAISFFFLKYFHNMAPKLPKAPSAPKSAPKKPEGGFDNLARGKRRP